MKKAIKLIKNNLYLPTNGTWDHIDNMIKSILSRDKILKIINLPKVASKLIKEKTTESIYSIDKINNFILAINIIGWTIWTSIDLIRDNQNYAIKNKDNYDHLFIYILLRPSIDKLIQSCSLSKSEADKVFRKICFMEYSNFIFCELAIKHQYILKSIGVAIPMLIFLIKIGASKKDIQSCYKYFYHFIGARQLSDDACDWREDMKKGQRTLVTEWLEEDIGKDRSVREYRKSFNRTVSPKVARKILQHAKTSMRYARKISCFTSTEFLEELPRFYKEMAQKILAKCAENKLRTE